MGKKAFKDREVDAGTVVLGDTARLSSPLGRFLFRCKKDGLDYLGQAGLNVREPSFRVEMFNGDYYARFEAPRADVHSALESKILARISGNEDIPADFVSVARSLLERKNPPSLIRLESKEEAPELQSLFDSLNREYFSGKISARIQWGKNILNQNRRSVRFGSYDFKKQLIRINPRLRQDFVPLQILELTVYHEMCHQFLPPFNQGGKRHAHHAEFKKKEREYKFYGMVKQWERRNWRKLMAPHPVGQRNPQID